jgi:hypothetical protein
MEVLHAGPDGSSRTGVPAAGAQRQCTNGGSAGGRRQDQGADIAAMIRLSVRAPPTLVAEELRGPDRANTSLWPWRHEEEPMTRLNVPIVDRESIDDPELIPAFEHTDLVGTPPTRKLLAMAHAPEIAKGMAAYWRLTAESQRVEIVFPFGPQPQRMIISTAMGSGKVQWPGIPDEHAMPFKNVEYLDDLFT